MENGERISEANIFHEMMHDYSMSPSAVDYKMRFWVSDVKVAKVGI